MEICLKRLVTVIYLSILNVVLSSSAADTIDEIVLTNNNNNNSSAPLHFKVERIETDLMVFRIGASIDFSYNETSDYNDELVSSPGCPKSHEGRPWIYYGSPPKCFLLGFRGPCPHGKRIFSVSNSKYGVCNCDCFTQEVTIRPSASHQVPAHSPDGIVDYEKHDISQNLILHPRRRSRSHYNSNTRKIRNSSLSFLDKFFGIRPCNSSQSTTTQTPNNDDNLEITSYFLPKASPLAESKDRYKFCYSNWYKRLVVYDSLRQECTPFLDQGPCQKEEWLVRDLGKENGVTCEPRKCPEIVGVNVKPEFGGSYSYFDYKRQACYTEVFGNLQESFFTNSGSIIPGNNVRFCRDAGMRYSQRLKTCVRDISKQFQYSAIG